MREKEDLGALRFGLLLILIYSRYLLRRAEAMAEQPAIGSQPGRKTAGL
jgi:hypothetical protein